MGKGEGRRIKPVTIAVTSQDGSMKSTYSLYTQASFLAKHRLQTGCSPPHLTLRLRQGSQEKALFLVARAELVAVMLLWLLWLLCEGPVLLEAGLDIGDMLAGKGGQVVPSCIRKTVEVVERSTGEPHGKAQGRMEIVL